jgi:hypothetical protein
VAKLLRLCEQKHGMDSPVMQQLRQKLDAIRLPQPNAAKKFATGHALIAVAR